MGRIITLVYGAFTLLASSAIVASAQENPYFITYDHHLEEPGSLEVAFNPVFGKPKSGNNFRASALEFEYGAKAWWTSELYLDGQSTSADSTIFTGWRLENRFRPLMREHWINPVLYIEFEDINGADKTLKEVVGFDSGRDIPANSEGRLEKLREIELKLILSSDLKGWKRTWAVAPGNSDTQ